MEILIFKAKPGGSSGGWTLASLSVLCLAVFQISSTAGPLYQTVDEYQVKAAFIYNFIKFVRWPAAVFDNTTKSISICVIGSDPFAGSLEETVAKHEIEGRTLSVRDISGIKQATGCHVIFVAGNRDMRPLPTPSELNSPGVLTIGDSSTAGTDGLIIRFKLESGKVRFEIDAAAAERGGLKISSRLLSLAAVAEPGRKRP